MDNNTQLENTTELFISAITDKHAAMKILNKYKNTMYREALLFLNNEQQAKETVVQAFRKAYLDMNQADLADPSGWLNHYVQDECLSLILPLERIAGHAYSSKDEEPNKSAVIPADRSTCRKRLISSLGYLNPAQRMISILYCRNHMSFEEIAERTSSDIETIQSIITSAKKEIKGANIDLGSLLAVLEHLYPKPVPEEPKLELPAAQQRTAAADPAQGYTDTVNDMEDIEFTTSVLELKNYFNKQKASPRHLSDGGIDEEPEVEEQNTVEPQNVTPNAEHTQELPLVKNEYEEPHINTRYINANPNSGYEDEDDDDDEGGFHFKWKYVIIILLAGLLAFGGGILFSMLNDRNNSRSSSSNNTAETTTPEATEQSEGADNSATEEPEQTAEPTPELKEDKKIGKAYINVTDLTMRKGPGTTYEQNGFAEPEATYDVYEIAEADGYTWYKVGEEEWAADYAGQYITYTPNE